MWKHHVKACTVIVLFTIHIAVAQEMTYKETEVSVSKHIDGTLLIPNDIEKPILVIIIAGSGPTDRNGNQNFPRQIAPQWEQWENINVKVSQ